MDNKLCFLMFSTNNLPIKNGNNYYDPKELDKYESSRIVQITWVISDNEPNKQIERTFIIKPDNYSVVNPKHNITDKIANMFGVSRNYVFDMLSSDLMDVSYLVSHNLPFYYYILLSELHRTGHNDLYNKIEQMETISVAHMATDILKIEGVHGNKLPSLGEMYKFCFNRDLNRTNNTKQDIHYVIECFYYFLNN